jgi:hypothetical protein
MPVIPAWLVRSNLNDPRRIPYLLVWKDARDGEIMEAVRLAHFTACGRGANDYVELKRTDGTATVLRVVWRMLPRNGGRALFLFCPACETPRRHVYGWQWDSVSGWSNRVRTISWRCRSCARLPALPKAATYAEAGAERLPPSFALTDLCRARSCGFPTCWSPSMLQPTSWENPCGWRAAVKGNSLKAVKKIAPHGFYSRVFMRGRQSSSSVFKFALSRADA